MDKTVTSPIKLFFSSAFFFFFFHCNKLPEEEVELVAFHFEVLLFWSSSPCREKRDVCVLLKMHLAAEMYFVLCLRRLSVEEFTPLWGV